MSMRRRHNLVLALYPSTRGIAFALFEGPLAPVDWSVSEMRGKDKNWRCLRRVRDILRRYTPDVLVLQDMSETGTKRASRIRRLNAAIDALASERGIPVYCYSRAQVRACFSHAAPATKHDIAEAIARHIPAFERFVPPVRKPWMSEHVRMDLFDAVALALTYFHAEGARLLQAA